MLCGSLTKIWKPHAKIKKHQNAKSICEKLKTFSYDLKDYKF